MRPLTIGLGAALALASFAACESQIASPTSGIVSELERPKHDDPKVVPPEVEIPQVPEAPAVPAIGGLRRLTNRELAASAADLLGVATATEIRSLPSDVLTPFDNDITKQTSSAVYVEALERAVANLSQSVLATPASRDAIVGCTPTVVDDRVCLNSFIERFGRRVLRRPVTPEEVVSFGLAMEFATRGNDFYRAVDVVIRRMLTDPEFLFRVEIGTPVEGKPGVFKLTQHELAARLSFTLWGTTPPDWLLDAADNDALTTDEEIAAVAARLLSDPRGMAHVQKYHAMWLGYSNEPGTDLERDFRTETQALVSRVFSGEDATMLITSTETFANERLATHYGLAGPPGGFPVGGFAWIPYGNTMRSGVLGQGSVLANGAKFNDTSPVARGKFLSERLLCRTLGSPPAEVNTDAPPQAPDMNPCKRARYAAHSANAVCKGCHASLDAIGFGLENFGPKGEYRTNEPALAQCAIDGLGTLGDNTSFHGPKELATQLVDHGEYEACVPTQLFRFVHGRRELPDDRLQIRDLKRGFRRTGRSIKVLLTTMVTSELFRFRVEESP